MAKPTDTEHPDDDALPPQPVHEDAADEHASATGDQDPRILPGHGTNGRDGTPPPSEPLAGDRPLDMFSTDRSATAAPGAAAPRGRRKPVPFRGAANDPKLMLRVLHLAFRPPYLGAKAIATVLKAEHPRITFEAVSAIVHKALEDRVVEVIINRPWEEKAREELAVRLVKRFQDRGLRCVKVVAAPDEVVKANDEITRRYVHREVVTALCAATAEIIEAFIARRVREAWHARREGREPDVVRLAVGWGATMDRLASYLWAHAHDPLPNLEVIPMVPASTVSHDRGLEASFVAMRIAEAYAGTCRQLPFPAFPTRGEASVLRRITANQDMLDRIGAAKMVVTSVAGVPHDGATVSNDPVVTAELRDSDPEQRARGRCAFWFWDERGHEVRLKKRDPMGIGMEGLRRAVIDPKRMAIVVTGGHVNRFQAVLGALRARIVSHLVTDEWTARYLIGESPEGIR